MGSHDEITSDKQVLGLVGRAFKAEKVGLLIALLVMIIVFSVLTQNKFLSASNIIDIFIASSMVGLVTIGETYLLIALQVDLSAGSVAGFSGVLVTLLLSWGLSMWVSIPVVIVVGGIIGFLNSLMVNKLKLEPFIATLASMSVFRGLAYIICGGKSVFVMNNTFLTMGVGRIFGIPIPVIIFLVMFLIFGIVLARTRFGRSVYMIGGNATAARLAGINAQTVKAKLYIMTAAFAALGGIILAARMSSGQPDASVGLEFDAVTAAVLGGVAFSGGIGTLGGALIGLIIMQGFNNGLMILNVQSFWQTVAKGLLLVAALSFDYVRNLKRKAKT
ncbi:Branched-chain amino acid transport system / permease component [Acididesulfobacillus acetoxydans]|uniref:Autoinducer 2 import system permease protein LsrD n=1 Tax=Acididesulfobacillus acetoxydans TaxID=1561005 RepID=A0A8S0WYB8_9FIRM|nr:ABC transporter permease [Acididesulfobacillus acetoxydans]CAA7601391.1 Branched-chain amino acid transport system / permease component [Acididesulfobacillus acetoxydans]CEJ08822.1 L-arabinose transport system permease protein AraH [Acididesulfobacillus acetoxydans]